MECDTLAERLKRAADSDPERAEVAGVFDALADYAKGKRKPGALQHALERFERRTNPMTQKTRMRDAQGRFKPATRVHMRPRVQQMRDAARDLIETGVLPRPLAHPRFAINYRPSNPDSGIRVLYPAAEGLVDVQFSASGWYEGDPDILGLWDPAASAAIHEDLTRPNPRRRV